MTRTLLVWAVLCGSVVASASPDWPVFCVRNGTKYRLQWMRASDGKSRVEFDYSTFCVDRGSAKYQDEYLVSLEDVRERKFVKVCRVRYTDVVASLVVEARSGTILCASEDGRSPAGAIENYYPYLGKELP